MCAEPSPGNRPVKVLVVDDEEDIVEYLRTVLEDNGFEVEGALRADEALAFQEKSAQLSENSPLPDAWIQVRGLYLALGRTEDARRADRQRPGAVLPDAGRSCRTGEEQGGRRQYLLHPRLLGIHRTLGVCRHARRDCFFYP